jgi:translocation and assembly module TamA
MKLWIWTALGLSLAATALAAEDGQPYRVELQSTGNGAIDATLKATSQLVALRTTAPVDPLGLIARAQGDVDRLNTVLDSFGYYQGSVLVKINDLGLNDPRLDDTLRAMPRGTDARATVSFTLGPLYHLRKIDIDGDLPPAMRAELHLAPGDPAVAETVLGAGARLLTQLEDQGYAFAKVDAPIAYEDPNEHVLDVSFKVEPGARVKIGAIKVEGLQRVRESLVRRRLLLHTGEQYNASNIEKARKDLLGLGVFAAISVQVGKAADESGGVPVTFQVRERARHGVTLNGAYSSDLGGSGGVTWSDRNVAGNAEQLNLSASIINMGGNATTGIGYDTSAKYIIPEFGHRDQSLQLAVGGIKQSLQAYDQRAITSGVTLTRKLSTTWSVSVGLTAVREQIIQAVSTEEVNGQPVPVPQIFDYTLLAMPLNVFYNTTDLTSPIEDATHGMRAALSVAPTLSLGGASNESSTAPDSHGNAKFVITQITVSEYFDLGGILHSEPGRSVLAFKELAGTALGASEFSLPPDQRFYAGGSGTVRGYRYQSIGPQVLTNPIGGTTDPLGGTSISGASAEYRQRFGKSFGAAFFLDGAQVSESLRPFSGGTRFGAGAGIRYYTLIGPIRLDFGLPIDRQPGDDKFEVYIGLGQAF